MVHSVVEMQNLAGAALELGEKHKPERGAVANEKPREAAEQSSLDPRVAALLSVTEENARNRAWRPPTREAFDEPNDDVLSGVFEQFDPMPGL
jgi:hypothetical protein